MAHMLRLSSLTATSVMVITILVYLAISIPLLIIHETVPGPPSNLISNNGLNISEAWLDLAELTNGYHPYNSRRNDEVHDWLLRRIEGILEGNGVEWTSERSHIPVTSQFDAANEPSEKQNLKNEEEAPFPGFVGIEMDEKKLAIDKEDLRKRTASPLVTIFNDLQSNVTCSASGRVGPSGQGRLPGQSVYFEGTNIIVYIRGTEDEEGEWWKSSLHLRNTHGQGGVLVNAHYDSVSTGFGATDDGVGVITVLQMIRYFTTSGNRPKKGIVALLNNGEEDFLNGARAFTQHPMSLFTHTFLNLEGAGAGGRAALFRTTDTEVTRAYTKSPNPFGTVVAADGFKQGAISSQTDYVVFEGILGLRGLDVAFLHPRARYHTNQDDARHTSVNSVWHMVSASLSTLKSLTSDTSNTFNSERGDNERGKVKNGKGSDGVWFDLFGKGFAVFGLRTLFAWSLTFLIACPLAVILIIYLLVQHDKFYFFSATAHHGDSEDGEPVSLYGWRGAFRWPLTFVAATGLTFGSGLLIAKINPLMVYSSQYAVWTMMLSLNFCIFWFIMRGADFVRPSALHRGYAYMWMFALGWVLLVFVTVFEDRYKVASGYMIVFYEIAIFFALVISLCELFALPAKAQFASIAQARQEAREDNAALPRSDALISPAVEGRPEAEPAEAENEPTESTPLVGNDDAGESRTTTFANYARRSLGRASIGSGIKDSIDRKYESYGREQAWSARLPQWTWLLQFLLVGPFMLVLIGQVGLFALTSLSQTGPDGSSLLVPYILMASVVTLILLPITPTIHRFTYHIPTFLFLVFIGTLIYNLVAFPFSSNNRYKAYFQQTVDLDTGSNTVTIAALEEYARSIIASIPSAAGQTIDCELRPLRLGVNFCTYTGIPPVVVPATPGVPPEKSYADWLTFNVSRHEGTNSATFNLAGQNTRACALRFARPIKAFHVVGASEDDRFDAVSESGSDQIKLWHRNWDENWEVRVEWPVSEGRQMGEEGMEGRVVCLWSDFNTAGVVPALDEVRRFAPPWSGVSKLSDGLVEGSKAFTV